MKTTELCKAALCVAVTCVSAYIAVPIPFSPLRITAQTLAINITALVLNPGHSAAVQAVYTLLGIIGLPVFSGGTGGIECLVGPSGGYLIGYILAVPLMSLAVGKGIGIRRNIAVTVCIGMPLIYICGILGMMIYLKDGIWAAAVSVLPFIPLDIIKCVIASNAAAAINKALIKR